MPRGDNAWQVAKRRDAPVAEVALVDEGEGGEGRLFGEAAPSIGVHVGHEVARPGAEIRVGGLPEGAENLVVACVGDAAVTVDAERPPRGEVRTRDEEVRCEVDPVLHAGGDKRVEHVEPLWIGHGVVEAFVPLRVH